MDASRVQSSHSVFRTTGTVSVGTDRAESDFALDFTMGVTGAHGGSEEVSDVDAGSDRAESEMVQDFTSKFVNERLDHLLSAHATHLERTLERAPQDGVCSRLQQDSAQPQTGVHEYCHAVGQTFGRDWITAPAGFPIESGRFTGRRRLRVPPPEPSPSIIRPGRLANAVGDGGDDPFCPKELHSSSQQGVDDDLPALKHLAALEEAVNSGAALQGQLPALPSSLSSTGPPSPPKSARGPCAWPLARTAGPRARSIRGIGSDAKATLDSRVRFHGEGAAWGLQPPPRPIARRPCGDASTMLSFNRSVLRGGSLLAGSGSRGPSATLRWIGTEHERLQAEVRKPLGSSAMVAFLANGGLQRRGRLDEPLCRPEVLS